MSAEKQTTKAKILAAIAEKKRAAKEESTMMIQGAREQAAETIAKGQKEADVLMGNTTFRNILFVHNNIIHDVKPNGFLTPFIPQTFDSGVRKQYETALADYHLANKKYRPYLTQTITEMIGGFIPVKKTVRIRNPKPRPVPPPIPPDKDKKLNAAVSDIIVDMHTQTMYWGRWAAPFRVFAMDMETQKVSTLYECERPVTSVALGPEVGENADKKSRTIYWMEGNERIMHGNLHGESSLAKREFLQIMAPDRGGLWQMEVDAFNKRIYWTNDISIWRTDITENPEPSTLMVISPSESSHPIDLAVDGYNGFLYWIDKDLKKIRRSDLEGVFIEDLYDIKMPTRGLKVDPNANLLYWSDETKDGHALRRGNTKNEVIRLDGQDDFIELPSIDPGKTFTIEMWINPDKTDNGQNFIGKHTKSGRNIFLMGYYQDNLIVNYNNVTKNISTDKITGHHHLAAVVTSNSGKPRVTVYRNGEKFGQSVDFNSWVNNWGNEPWVVGKDIDPSGSNDFFDGGVSEVRIWNAIRSASKIKAERFNRLQGNEDNLVGYWQVNERQGELLPDLTLKGNYARIHRKFHLQPEVSLLNLDGKSHSIVVPEFNQTFVDGLTIEFWLNLKKYKDYSYIMDFGNGPVSDNLMVVTRKVPEHDKGNIGIFIRPFENKSDWHVFESWGVIELNVWNHISITLDPNGQVHVYKNGKLIGSSIKDYEVSLPRDVLRTQNFIGKSNNGGTKNMLNGKLLDLRMWNRPLREEEIFSRMHQRLTGREEHLWAYWPMTESKGEIVKDVTPGFLDGKIFDPKKKQRERFIELRQTMKLQLQKIDATTQKHDTLQGQMNLRKSILELIKNREAEIKVLLQNASALREEKVPLMHMLSKLNAKMVQFRNQTLSLKKQRAITDQQIAVLNTQRAQLQAMNIFGMHNAQIKALEKKISQYRNKNKAIIKDLSATEKQARVILKEQKELGERIQKLNQLITDHERAISSLRKEVEVDSARELERLNRAIGDKKLTPLKAEIKALKALIKEHQNEFDALSQEFAMGVENLWQSEFPPVNNVIIEEPEAETIIGIPGLDGLELVPAIEYAKAKRKKAFDELHRIREQGAREKAHAEALAAKKRKEGEQLKAASVEKANQEKAAATREAERKKRNALTDKTRAERNAKAKKAAAERKKNDRISKAHAEASAKKEAARIGANNKVAAAKRKKSNAQTEVNRANAEKSARIG